MTDQPLTPQPAWPRTYVVLFASLLVSLPFSYQPLITLGHADGASYDFSIIYLTLAATVVVALPALWQARRWLWRNALNRVLAAFLLWNLISILWSANPLRGSATAGLIGLGTLLIYSIEVYRSVLAVYRSQLLVVLKWLTLVIGLFCLYQLFGAALGISDRWTLLPATYGPQVFGFARITGFSAEPEFLGSLLLIPLGIFSYLALIRQRWDEIALAGFSLLLTILTLSRGALIGSVILVALLLWGYRQRCSCRRLILLVGSFVLAIALATSSFALATALNPRVSVSASQAVDRAISQLSLGVVKLHSATPVKVTTTSHHAAVPHAASDGYVAVSTTSRLQMVSAAFDLLTTRPARLIYGVGLGGFGATLHQQTPKFSRGSIVNNQYVEVLTELGVIGLGLFVAFFALLYHALWRARNYLFGAIITALLVQWLFFSGYPNILHLWPVLGLALIFAPNTRYRANDSL